MTVQLGTVGTATTGGIATLQPPKGFNTVTAVRITNGTQAFILVNNPHGDGTGSQEVLPPGYQNVYRTQNIQLKVTLELYYPPVSDATMELDPFFGAGITAEYTDQVQPQDDFPGTYPMNVGTMPFIVSHEDDDTEGWSPFFSFLVPDTDTVRIPPNALRTSISLQVNSETAGVVTVTRHAIPSGSADEVTLESGQSLTTSWQGAIYVTTPSTATLVYAVQS